MFVEYGLSWATNTGPAVEEPKNVLVRRAAEKMRKRICRNKKSACHQSKSRKLRRDELFRHNKWTSIVSNQIFQPTWGVFLYLIRSANKQFIQDRIRNLVDKFSHRTQAVRQRIEMPATPSSISSRETIDQSVTTRSTCRSLDLSEKEKVLESHGKTDEEVEILDQTFARWVTLLVFKIWGWVKRTKSRRIGL